MRKLYLLPHTHWDREWYQPFESFRLQLVGVVRQVLDRLESGELPSFYLDGQSIVFDDVLDIAPELRSRLEANMRSGRLSAGPWYVLADQMLVGGESLVRNLGFGLRDTARFGTPAMVGYCPDTFGHSQDLPRILRGFGIKNAVVWRGVPLLPMGPLFWWTSPDGSRVLAYHLTHGYYQTAFHENAGALEDACAADRLGNSLLPWVELGQSTNGNASSFYKPLNGALMPVGADHVGPPARFAALVKRLNSRFQKQGIKLSLVPTSLSEFLETASQRAAREMNVIWGFDGELRSNRAAAYYQRAYLLYGVLSTRLYLKRANAFAEHKLQAVVEPLFTLLNAGARSVYPAAQLEYAWRLLLKNHPHDSICGCSVDAVHRQMVDRFARLDHLLDGLLEDASRALCPSSDANLSPADPDSGCQNWLVYNCGLRPLKGPVPVRWFEKAGSKAATNSQAVVQIEHRRRVNQLFSGFGIVPYYKEVQELEGYLWPGAIEGLSAKSIAGTDEAGDGSEAVVVRPHRISNGLLDVNVSAAGRLSVDALQGDGSTRTYKINHQFADVGDAGDTYNFDPLPNDVAIGAKFVGSTVISKGPLLATIALTFEMELPEQAVEDSGFLSYTKLSELGNIKRLKRSARRLKHRIETRVTLKRGVGIVFFETEWENRASDHRLRVSFDTEQPVTDTFSENHFSLVHRLHGPKVRRSERLPVAKDCEALPDAFPCRRFFIANGQLFLNSGLPEYSVEGKQVSLTLLRAVSQLSRPQLFTRGGGAGPHLPVPEANCPGVNRTTYGWAPLPSSRQKPPLQALPDEVVVSAYELAEEFMPACFATRSAAGAAEAPLVRVDNRAIVMTALYEQEGNLLLRLLNVTAIPQQAILRFSKRPAGIQLVNLGGQAIRQLPLEKDVLRLEWGKNELLTLQVDR